MNSNRLSVGTIALLFAAICLFSVNSASAQSHTMHITVPFSFYVGDDLMPAGDYEIAAFEKALRLQNNNTHLAAGIQTLPIKKVSGVVNYPELIFNKYGNDYFLTQVWWGLGLSIGSMPMISEREVEIAKSTHPVRIEARAHR